MRDIEREEFEKCLKDEGLDHCRLSSAIGWRVWQAARQAPASGEVEPDGYAVVDSNNEFHFIIERGDSPEDSLFLCREHINDSESEAEYEGLEIKPVFFRPTSSDDHPPAKVPEGFILVPTPLVERWANVDAFNAPKGAAMEIKIIAQHMLTTPTPATTPETECDEDEDEEVRECYYCGEESCDCDML